MESLDHKFLRKQLEKNPSLKKIYNHIKHDLELVEERLGHFTRSSNVLVSEISSYLFQKAGKRIRPAILILSSKLLGYKGNEHILTSALIETIHTASLIHDDIIDNSEVRRGKETVHARWGPNITVLLGDWLYIQAIGLSVQNCCKEITQILADVSAQMIEGELDEYSMSGNLDMEESTYLDILNKKTASLFSATCQIGAVLAKASEEKVSLLTEFGANVGMSFQIIDDLLDFTGDKRSLGKPVLSDLSEGRITLPLIYTLKQANKTQRDSLMKFFNNKQELNQHSIEKILKIVHSNGALEYTFQKATEYALRSKEKLKNLPPSIYRDSLFLIPDYILYRNT